MYYSRLYVYQLYKNRHHGMAMLPRARDIDDVAPTRPAPNQTLAATPTLTMTVPLPCREAGLLLCRSWMAWGWLSETRGSGGSGSAQVENCAGPS